MCELRAVLKGLQRHEGFFHRVQSRCRLKGAQRAQISPRLVPPNDDEQPLSTAPSENMAPRTRTFDAPPVLQCHRKNVRRQGSGPRCNNAATVAMFARRIYRGRSAGTASKPPAAGGKKLEMPPIHFIGTSVESVCFVNVSRVLLLQSYLDHTLTISHFTLINC